MDFENGDIELFENRILPIMKFYNKDKYHISYFGGEPLKNWKIIEYTLPKFNASKYCHSIVLISNGLLLTQEKVDFLKHYNCGLSWSFDGLWSNRNRPLAVKDNPNNPGIHFSENVGNSNNPKVKNTNSFEKYMEILPLAKQLTTSCKVMVNPWSFNTLTENFKFFIDNGIYHPDFSIVRDNIYRESDILTYSKEIKRLADFIINENEKHLCSAGFFTLYTLDTLAYSLFGKRKHGCFVGVNGLMYAYDGSIWPCERFRSRNKLCLYKDNEYFWNNIELLNSNEISNPQTYSECKNCELYGVCNSQCLFSMIKFKNPNNPNNPDNHLSENIGNIGNSKNFNISINPIKPVCELFKLTYKEAFRIYKESNQRYRDYIHNQVLQGFNN